MQIEDLYQFLGKQYEVLCDCRIFSEGTHLLVKNIDIRKNNDDVLVRFVCNVRVGNSHLQDSVYIDAFEFAECVGIFLREIKL